MKTPFFCFKERLLDKLTNEMTNAPDDLSHLFGNENAHLTIEERVAKWKFGDLDRNRNGVISRRELQPFRRALKGDRELRLCGKRIQMHCDADGDKSITEREWDACLGVKEGGRNQRTGSVKLIC